MVEISWDRLHSKTNKYKIGEEEKILFKGYVQGKCDEEMYNEMKAEIDDICEKIIDVTVNAGKILKSPII